MNFLGVCSLALLWLELFRIVLLGLVVLGWEDVLVSLCPGWLRWSLFVKTIWLEKESKLLRLELFLS